MKFSLNCKKFEKKYLNDIKLGILNFYSKKYHNVQIKYKKSKNIYTFFIYVDLDVVENNEWYQETVLIKSYNNTQAIENFAQIALSEYKEEYDDSTKGYLQKFLDEMDAIVIMYKTLGMNLEIEKHNPKRHEYSVIYDRGLSSWMGRKWIYMNYNYDGMMTREEYKTNISYLKKSLSLYYDKFQQK